MQAHTGTHTQSITPMSLPPGTSCDTLSSEVQIPQTQQKPLRLSWETSASVPIAPSKHFSGGTGPLAPLALRLRSSPQSHQPSPPWLASCSHRSFSDTDAQAWEHCQPPPFPGGPKEEAVTCHRHSRRLGHSAGDHSTGKRQTTLSWHSGNLPSQPVPALTPDLQLWCYTPHLHPAFLRSLLPTPNIIVPSNPSPSGCQGPILISCGSVLSTESCFGTFQRPRNSFLLPKKTICPGPWQLHFEQAQKRSEIQSRAWP